MVVCIYARVSTDHQELDHQIQACKRFCESKQLVVGYVFTDIFTGKTLDRPGFNMMVEQLKAKTFDGIVVFRFDRLGRNMKEIIEFFDWAASQNINIYSVHESFDTTTPIGSAIRDFIVRIAQLEREMISEASKQRLAALKQAGKLYHRPKGAKDKKPRRRLGYFMRWERELQKTSKKRIS